MRAKLIYEKFTQDSDPIHDMGIGTELAHIKKGSIVEIIKPMYGDKGTLMNHKYSLYNLIFFVETDQFLYPGIQGVVLKTKRVQGKIELYIMFYYDKRKISKIREMILHTDFENFVNSGNYAICRAKESILVWEKHIKLMKR